MPSRAPSIPERFLRQLWKHQLIKTLSLTSADGKPLIILSPGVVNTDAGPDFVDAVIKIGGVTHRGDVELHQTLKDWKQHAHHADARYNRVVLHVVLNTDPTDVPSLTKSKRPVPLLVLSPYLNRSLGDVWHSMLLGERAERLAHIPCYGKNNSVSAETIRSWLGKLAIERMELKVRRFEDRLRELAREDRLRVREPATRYGMIPFGLNPEELPLPSKDLSARDAAKLKLWEQLLYEGIMEALGYSKNREPFVRLARNLRLEVIKASAEQRIGVDLQRDTEAKFFGASGLLSLDIRPLDSEGKGYVKQLRSVWEAWRNAYAGEVLHPSDWKFFRLRPENFPTVRIAGVARLSITMAGRDYVKTIIQTLKADNVSRREKAERLRSLFIVAADGFWQTHYRFEERSLVPLKVLIGHSRANDVIVNVVLPLSFLYARLFRDRDVRREALDLYRAFPNLADNAITRTIEHQLVKQRFACESAFFQQGAIQLYKYYCLEERCKECMVGKVVFTA